MPARLRDLVIVALVVLPTGAAAQPIREAPGTLVTLADERSTARYAAEEIAKASRGSGWTVTAAPDGCDRIQRFLNARDAAIVITSESCLASVDLGAVSTLRMVGTPIRFLVPADDTRPNPFAVSGVIGTLSAYSSYRQQVELAIQGLTGATKPATRVFSSYKRLADALATHTIGIAFVVEDGTGAAVRELNAEVPLKAARMPARSDTIPGGGYLMASAHDSPAVWSTPADSQQPTLSLPLDQADPERSRRTSEWKISWLWSGRPVQAATQPEIAPLRVKLPIILTRGTIPPELAEAVARTSLSALISAPVNPCNVKSERIYRAFVVNAITDATSAAQRLRLAALREHATLLNSRNYGDVSVFSQVPAIDRQMGGAGWQERLVEQVLKPPSQGEVCPAPKRDWFGQLTVGATKLAYYGEAVDAVRQVLWGAEPAAPLIAKARSCLWNAWKEPEGHQPSCGAPSGGMFYDYYAPFLPLAVLENRKPQ